MATTLNPLRELSDEDRAVKVAVVDRILAHVDVETVKSATLNDAKQWAEIAMTLMGEDTDRNDIISQAAIHLRTQARVKSRIGK